MYAVLVQESLIVAQGREGEHVYGLDGALERQVLERQ